MAKSSRRPPPDNPFPTRPEDQLNKGLRAGIGALPVVGSTLTEFLAFVVGDPAQERRDDFMKETLERVLDLQENFEQLESEALRLNEQFQATFIQATRLSTQTASDEKRRLLQNAACCAAKLAEQSCRQSERSADDVFNFDGRPGSGRRSCHTGAENQPGYSRADSRRS